MEKNKILIDRIMKIAREYGANKLVLFGSFWENPENANDIDIACDIPGLGLLSFAGKLESLLRMNVDVIPLEPENSFTDYIYKTGKTIYV